MSVIWPGQMAYAQVAEACGAVYGSEGSVSDSCERHMQAGCLRAGAVVRGGVCPGLSCGGWSGALGDWHEQVVPRR
jgi:hypothetical protein